jgi:hypothetical protein
LFWGKGGTVTKPAEGSYAYFVYHVAALAERTKAEIVSVSVELSSANGQEAHFRRLIGGVRSIFSGKVHCDVASAPLSSTKAITDVRFWDALDAVGVDAYPALTAGIPANETNPTVAQLVAAFSPVLKLMSDYYHGRFPPAPPPPPLPPPCGLGGHITNFSNLAPHHLAGPSGPNTRWVQYIGVAGTFAECANLCHNRKNCTSWSWHPQDASASSQHCFSRSDGAWQPEYSLGDVCGRVNDTPVPSPPAPSPPTWWPARNKVPIKIVWAENGLISAPNSFRHPGGAYNSAHPDPVCLECQARYYEAFFKAVLCNPDAHEWFGGVYWWKWSSDPNPWSDDGAVGNNRASGNNSDFFPQHKPAEKVLTKYYREGCPLPLKTDDDATLGQDSDDGSGGGGPACVVDGVARVTCFGPFNVSDSTSMLQAALSSNASKVIIEKSPSGGPWFVRPLYVTRCNQVLVFEEGVHIMAKRDEFHGLYDTLLGINSVHNLTIWGNGAILQMRRDDYAVPSRGTCPSCAPYSKAEWRMGIGLRGSSSIRSVPSPTHSPTCREPFSFEQL